MSKLWLLGDAHLGHKNIHKYRTNFNTAEEHHATIWENLATTVGKRDTVMFLGDIAFTHEWLLKIEKLACLKKVLVAGNHDTERGITMRHIVNAYDEVHAILSYRNYWFTHCPIHPQELRGRKGNIHGHLHGNHVWANTETPEETEYIYHNGGHAETDKRFINVCLEHNDWKPITFQDATA